MIDNENRDCVKYDKDKVTLTVPVPKEYYVKRIVAVVIAAMALILLTAVCVGGVWGLTRLWGNGGSGDRSDGFGESEEDEKKEENDTSDLPGRDEDENEQENHFGGNDGKEESGEMSESEGDIGDEPPIEKDNSPVETDVSFAERGDAYIINYSRLSPDAEGILEMGFSGSRYAYTEEPVVLILHTHTSEGYADMDVSQPLHVLTRSVVAAGELLAQGLTARGIPTVHCSVIHDGGDGNPYVAAAETIMTMLEIYPSIEYVIDLHRLDEVSEEGRRLKTLSAKGTAQVRVTVSDGGGNVKDTLALAMSLRRELNRDGARVCMPTVLTDSEYNAGLVPYYLKLDLGASGNSSSEAMAAAELVTDAIAEVLKK